MTAKKGGTLLVARVAAAPAFADWPTPADPNGPKAGASRTVAQLPTIVGPNGPNSDAGRIMG
jgi:hypothetical protein